MDTEIQVVVQATCACELTWPLPCTRRRLSRRSCSCAAERPGTPPWSCAASSHARACTIPAALIVHRESLEWEYELAAKVQYWENRQGEMHDTELWTYREVEFAFWGLWAPVLERCKIVGVGCCLLIVKSSCQDTRLRLCLIGEFFWVWIM